MTHSPSFSLYAQRRAHLAAQLGAGGGGIALIPTASEHPRNRDSDFLFRHDSYFYYLTGFTEPNAWLLLTAEGHSTLLCQPKDVEREIWDGIRLGPDAAPEALGVDAAFSVAEIDQHLPRSLENQISVWYPFATHLGLEGRIATWLGTVRGRARLGVLCPRQHNDLCGPLDEMRLIKDAHEQATMRRAAQISAGGHVRAMQRCAQMLRKGQEVREYHLDAELLHEFRQHGSEYSAYNAIVAAGANACVLHYRADAARIHSGDLVLIDAGCELNGYASDITRTFPANGRFTGPQRDLYELVLASQEAAIHATRAGARFNAPHEATIAVLSQGLLDLGLLDYTKVGNAQDVITQRAYQPFYMHRTSHWLGMDVHDCGSYTESSEITPLSTERPSRILRPGMVITIEPGLYIRPAPNVPEVFHGMGIRIEDDAIITEEGCELISRGVPVHPDKIEALMCKF